MLVSKLASLHSDAIHPKLIASMAPHDKTLIETAWEINYLYFLSLEEDMITFNESFPFSKPFFFFFFPFRSCQSRPNSTHNVCVFVSGMKTNITAIKEESRNKNLIILFVSCSKSYLHRNYRYCCCARDSNAVYIILVLHHSYAWRQKWNSAKVCQDGSSIHQKMCKCVTLMYLLINYIDLSHLFEFSPTRWRPKSVRGCTNLPSWPIVRWYRTELTPGV